MAIFMIMASVSVFSQAKSGLENYNYMSSGQAYSWMPVAHYQAQKGYYAELRYNYEDVKTVSFYSGKTFFSGKERQISITPMAGLAVGEFTGISAACKAEAETGILFFSTEFQYSRDFKNADGSFMFSWSEAGVSFLDYGFAGLAMQTTFQKGASFIEPGVVAGFSAGRVTVPLYLFNPFCKEKWFLLGINYEFQIKRKK